MWLLGIALFIFVCAVRSMKSARDTDADYRRVRREGVRMQAEVVDYDKIPARGANEFYLHPIVRYHLNDRWYQSTLQNAQGTGAPPLGSYRTVLVSPTTPYDAYDPDGGTESFVWFALALLLASSGFLLWAILRL